MPVGGVLLGEGQLIVVINMFITAFHYQNYQRILRSGLGALFYL